jgi:hypothetical protein
LHPLANNGPNMSVSNGLSAAKDDKVLFIRPVEPPRFIMIRWAMGTGSAEMFEGQERMDMWSAFLHHPRGAYYRRSMALQETGLTHKPWDECNSFLQFTLWPGPIDTHTNLLF